MKNPLKKSLKNSKKIIYWIVAVLAFVLGWLLTFESRADRQDRQEYAVVVFGDSIMGQYRDETSVPAQIGALLHKSTFNGALGGTCMSRSDSEMRMGYAMDFLSVVGIAEAIQAGDFGVQQTARVREAATEYFAETIDTLETIDFEKTEIIVIGAGVNDYHAGTAIYSEADPYDAYTFTGALRSVIRHIRETYPHIRIVLATPTYTWYTTLDLTCEEYNTGGGLLEEYVEAELAVAREMDVEIIDLYHDFYPHDKWEDWELYTRDGLHPNDAGRTMIAEKIAAYLQGTNIEGQEK